MIKKKGYTMMEMVVVIFIMTLIVGVAFGFMQTAFKQYRMVNGAIDNPISDLRIINTIEEVITGCSSVSVEPERISVTSSKGLIVIHSDDFSNKKTVVFAQREDTILVSIGGDLYWIPILYEY